MARAVGLDVSLEMLSAAKGRGGEALLVAADARRVAFRPVFDLIVAPGDPISHLTALADRRRALRAVADQLAPRGKFVLEGLYRGRREAARSPRRIRHSGGILTIEESWVPLGVRELWHARYRYRDRLRDGSVRTRTAAFLARAWDPAALPAFFRACGLEIEALWGGFDRTPFRREASRLLVVARRASRSRARPVPSLERTAVL